ncbi:hypothetical protein S100390_v1c05060 [Spiroplasma sp. NBRC 100390]|uniref:hypothetical protein n=1 Tax=unclassified Spiroplasma TaxID=2637901 RepID=UPI00089280DD|nr:MULTISPECIES: hypothetical protein [unclassified Spiroplasma]AOX43846.1 hypothetical protein STU14_v1c05060 [Spiroplasma sp. TU-14]APE13316.1 hypothetical protein S100390_v1c05060 [Spiroplasma sp. NBRC 100390]
MNKLLSILGPAIIALSSATTVNVVNSNSTIVSNHSYQAQETEVFTHEFSIPVDETDNSKPKIGSFDVTESLVSVIEEMKAFVLENNAIGIKITSFQSAFKLLNIRPIIYLDDVKNKQIQDINAAFIFAISNPDVKMHLKLDIIDAGFHSYFMKLKGEITDSHGNLTHKIDLSTYQDLQTYSAHQLLGGYSNIITLGYESLVTNINHIDSEYNSGIEIKNYGFYWYAHQVKTAFSFKLDKDGSGYYYDALKYLNKTLKLENDDLYVEKIQAAIHTDGKVTFEPGDDYEDMHLVLKDYFYVVLKVYGLDGEFKMLVKNIIL